MPGSNLTPTDQAVQPDDTDLLKSRHELHLAISSLPHVLLQVNRQERITAFIIPSDFPHILNTQTMPDQPLVEALPLPLLEPIALALAEVRETGKVVTLEQACLHDDEVLYFEIKAAPIVESDGLLITMSDITRRKRAEIAEHEQRIFAEALVETATALNSTLELDEVLDQLLANLHRAVPHDRSSIMMVEQGIARVVRCRGYDDQPEIQDEITRARLVVADVPNLCLMTETHQPLLIRDTSEHSDWLTVAGVAMTGAYAGVPIRGGSEVIGFINLDSAEVGAFSTRDRARLQAFADQAAIALTNATLFKQLQMRNSELDAFTHTVAHDLKSPLAAVMGYTNLLAMTIGERSAEIDGYFNMIVSRVTTMGGIIESLLLLATVRDSSEAIGEVDVRPVIEAALTRYEGDIQQKQITVTIEDGLPQVMGYGPWLEEVFANLIGNAVKYIERNQGVRRIEIRGVTEDGWVRYEVHDTGPGIDPRDQSRLFHMFTRFHQNQAKGHGLGLSIVQRIVTKLGGSVGVISHPGQGSTFWFSLPGA